MYEDFIKRAIIKRDDYLLKTEELFVSNKNLWLNDFAEHFQSVCDKIRKMQDRLDIAALSYLEYTMLYTNFVNRQYVAEVRVYGYESYLDKTQQAIDDYDISFLFVYFDKLWDDLLTERKRYIGKVKASDVNSFMLKTSRDFYLYLVKIARYAVARCVKSKSFINIDKNEKFILNIGDYMAETKTIYY
ncbi:MAG: hypothetical protein FWH57_04995 [Oscillospiraceae bacterium]|nr:hypothetical protein [Oscillospiraceae bacterium]